MTLDAVSETDAAGPVALCAIQMRIGVEDFASEDGFADHVERLASRAVERARELIEQGGVRRATRHRLLVFPENVGMFLPLIWAPARARHQRTIDDAIAVAASRSLATIAGAAWRTRSLRQAVLLALMPAADRFMRRVFSSLARRHRSYVVAGSHLCPVGDTGHRGLSNTSLLFGPDGALLATTRKVNLVPGMEDDLPGGLALVRGHRGGLRAVATPWGTLATLICYDGFCRPHSRFERFVFLGAEADARQVRVIANPSANPWPWHRRWLYADAGSQLARCEQWRREGLAGTMKQLHEVRYGVTAHLCGQVLDVEFSGQSEILAARNGAIECLARSDDPRGEDVVAAIVDAGVDTIVDARPDTAVEASRRP